MKVAALLGVPAVEPTACRALGLAWCAKPRALLRRAWEKLVPLGYEDESGFHFGVNPAEQPTERGTR